MCGKKAARGVKALQAAADAVVPPTGALFTEALDGPAKAEAALKEIAADSKALAVVAVPE